MKKRKKEELIYNFWPNFADLAIVTIFLLLLFVVIQVIDVKLSDAERMREIYEKQREVISKIKNNLGSDSTIILKDSVNKVNQTISFSGSFLFKEGLPVFKNEKSKNLITNIGKVLKAEVEKDLISRIIIEGHTNNRIIAKDPLYGNWTLSAERAIAIVKLFDQIGIKINNSQNSNRPSRVLSIAGFSQYDYVPLPKDSTKEDEELSKRIQLSLEYK
jgi:flagellar motor protein MotB